MKRNYKISCIIPACNEAERISCVLNTVNNHYLLEEVLVIENFSKDNTLEVVKKFIKENKSKNIRLYKENEFPGKAYAMYYGVRKSKNNIILFLDADLVGLTKQNIKSLVQPIVNGEVDMTISLRSDCSLLGKLLWLDYISGERAMKKSLFLGMPTIKYTKFGVEVAMNDFIIKNKKSIKIIPLKTVSNPMKYQKHGIIHGWLSEIKMVNDIFKIVSPVEFYRQGAYLSKIAKY